MKNWKFSDYLAAVENGTSVLIICIICFAILFQVTSRFLLKVPLSWTEEVSRFSLIWLTFIAASLALRDNGHFAVDVISHRLAPKFRKYYQIGILLLMLVYLLVMLKTGITLVPIAHMQESPALDMHMSYVYLAIPCGAALMIINVLLKIHGLATAK
jgi:TRAP-type C4-dicarboxylate transport system permease small subunit